MRQTATTAVRASVMLLALAGLFGAALLYNSPERRAELLESILESEWIEGGGGTTAPAEPPPGRYAGGTAPQAELSNEAPRWNRPASLDQSDSPDPRAVVGAQTPPKTIERAIAGLPSSPMSRPAAAAPAATPLGARVDSGVQPAGHSQPAPPSVFSGGARTESSGPFASQTYDAGAFRERGSEADRGRDVAIGPQNGPSARTDTGAVADTAAGIDRFTQIERRLRELGATYYLLESWGSDANLYRFHCRMAIGGRRDHNRYFEATEAQPLVAMEQVLRDVERWRSGIAW